MRKLAIALGIAAAVLLGGSLEWKADATPLRSGTSIFRPRRRTIRRSSRPPVVDGGGIARRDYLALWPVAVLVQAVLVRGMSGLSGRQTLSEAASRGGLLLCARAGSGPFCPCQGARNFNNLRFTARGKSSELARPSRLEAGMESVRRRLRHDELTFSAFCLRARRGLAQAARGGDGLLGRGSRGAARAIPRPHERCSEHRAVS